jgi:prepilin-type N-terminal cleavage/methylation domain-containing protein
MKTKHKSGFSLIEIMVAIIILVVLALGGAAVMYQTGGGIQRQQNKREAIVAANRVLEKYWNTTYVANAAGKGLADVVGSPIQETVLVNGNTMLGSVMISSGTTGTDNYYEIMVTIPYMTGDDVVLTSRRYEKGLSKARVN